MKYTIISLNDDRLEYKERIRERVSGKEIFLPAVNGHTADLEHELYARGVDVTSERKRGEIGVFLSTMNCWAWAADHNEPLLVFEDDAIPTEGFDNLFAKFIAEMPTDYDFLSLWIPDNQLVDYTYDVVFDEHGSPTHVGPNKLAALSIFNYGGIRLSRVYQGYGNVAMLYSPQGARKLYTEAVRQGINNPIDCFIFNQAHTKRVTGYAPKPIWARAVEYDWAAETTVHNTERHL